MLKIKLCHQHDHDMCDLIVQMFFPSFIEMFYCSLYRLSLVHYIIALLYKTFMSISIVVKQIINNSYLQLIH